LVEPGGPNGAGLVTDLDREDREAATTEGSRRVGEHLDADRGLLPDLQIADGENSSVSMAVRDAIEQISDGRNPGVGRSLGETGADALERLQRRVKDAGTRPMDRGVKELCPVELGGAGERAHYWAASSHHQLG
jgi:hypothetical protein